MLIVKVAVMYFLISLMFVSKLLNQHVICEQKWMWRNHPKKTRNPERPQVFTLVKLQFE